MKNFYEGQVIGIPVGSSDCGPDAAIKEERSSGFSWITKLRKVTNNLRKTRHGDMHEQKTQYQPSKLERLMRKSFSIDKDERLIKVCKCYLSTTAGPIKGTLLISTRKVAFLSDESLKVTSPKGKIIAVPYKVLIPVKKIKETIPSENAKNPNDKYLQVVTVDNFDFWFMGLLKNQNHLVAKKRLSLKHNSIFEFFCYLLRLND